MREKNRRTWRIFKITVTIALIASVVYLIMNRVSIKDHLMTYFM